MMNDDGTPGCDVKTDGPNDQKGRHDDVFEEVVLIAHDLQRTGVLATSSEQVRCVRRRFGRYERIDVVAVLIGSAISGERT